VSTPPVMGRREKTRRDAFRVRYTICCSAFLLFYAVVLCLDEVYNFYLAIVPMLLVPLVLLTAALVTSFAINVFRRRWRATLSVLVAPVIALSSFGLFYRLGVTPELIRLEFSKSIYLAEVDALPTADGPRLECWNWGGTGGAAVANTFRNLVYDESDQIALPPSARSAAWGGKASGAGKGKCSAVPPETGDAQVSVNHLEGHFYVIEQLYQ